MRNIVFCKLETFFIDEPNTYIAYILDIINTTMMPTLMGNIQSFKHAYHSHRSIILGHFLCKHFFNVDIVFKIFSYLYIFGFGFIFETVGQVPVSACHEGKVFSLQEFVTFYPFIKLF